MKAWVVPRSSSERDVSGGRVDVEMSPVAVVGVGGVYGAGIGSSRGDGMVLPPVCVGIFDLRGVCLLLG